MSLIRILSLLACGAACGLNAAAGEAPLALQGPGGYYLLQLPPAVQSQTRSADLSDVLVLNARGEPVPFAWANEEASAESSERRQEVSLFEAPRKASAAEAALRGGWILDTRSVQGSRLRLELQLAAGARGIYAMALDASDDLQRWQTVRPSLQLLSLQHRGQRLEQTRVDLEGVQARYLRLRPLPGSASAPLVGARVVSVTSRALPPPLQWSEPIVASSCTTQVCDYPLPRHLPLDRFELQLAEINTLARVTLLGLADPATLPAATAPRRKGVRGRLKELRQKDRPLPSEPVREWNTLAETSVYWLALPDAEVRSPALALPGGLYEQLRVQPVGGVTQLGARAPTLRVGSRPRALVFLARGPAPYRLAWGGEVSGAPLSLAELMPARQAGEPLPAGIAVLAPAAPAPAASAAAVAASAAAVPAPAIRVHWLWGALVLALGLMGFMAWSLLRASPARPTAESGG